MISEVKVTFGVPYDLNNNNKKIPVSAIANCFLKSLSVTKACEYGYFLGVTKLVKIGPGDNKLDPQVVIFPVSCLCRIFKPVHGEIMIGIVHTIHDMGITLKTGPMNMVYLSARKMPSNYHFVPGEDPVYIRDDDLSLIKMGTVLRYKVIAVRWKEDSYREFRVLVTINEDGLGPVSSDELDGLDF